jgi:hypothetical protein
VKKRPDQSQACNKTRRITRVVGSALAALFLFALTGPVNAGVPELARSPCDPEHWDSLKYRAWTEAEREVMQNQNLIYKPDSVLEYTCFNRFADLLASQAIDLFSETQKWGLILPDDSMDKALQSLVGKAVQNWICFNYENKEGYHNNGAIATDCPVKNGNLRYDLLGGRISGLDYEPAEISGGDYSCMIMENIWLKAKCKNFVDVPDEDGFFTLKEYTEKDDVRFLPDRCEGIQERFAKNLEGAVDDDPFDNKDTTKWNEDDTITYIKRFDPGNCNKRDNSGKLISPPIDTGLLVRRNPEPREYYEKICVAPGCYYEPTSKTEGNCVKQ